MSYARQRVVFDTSALIAACLYPDREPAQIVRRTVLAHDVVASVDTLSELVTVLARDKFNAWRSLEQRLMWLKLFREAVVLVETVTALAACRDPKDNKFLALALAAQAHVIVSSDVHLLEMHPFQGIPILQLTPFKQQFLDRA